MVNLRRSLVINFMASSGATLVQFLVSVLLARILSPSEIGIFSITIVFVNIAHIFRDFGVATYLQREPELTPEKTRAAIGVLFTSSWLIAILLYLSSGWIAAWFKEPAIVPTMEVLALGFLFIPFGAVTHALLTRQFAAEKQAIVTVAGTLSYSATCLGLAALGFGTMSLAWANLVNIIVCGLAYIPLRPKGTPWLPSFRNWGSVVNFGIGTLLTNCAQAVNNAIPDVLLGKLGSAKHVGLFSRANSTVTIFTYVAGSTVNYGALSYISQAHHRGESLAPLLSRATALLTGVGWPVLTLTALLGKDIVLVLYGPNWLECVPAIFPLAAAAAFMMAFHYVPTALTALGRPYLAAFPLTLSVLTRIAFGVWLFDGTLHSFAWTVFLATLATMPVMVVQQKKYLGVPMRQMLRAQLPSALVSTAVALAAEFLMMLLPASIPAIVRLFSMSLPLIVVWYLTLRMTRHELLPEVHHLTTGLKMRLMRQC